MSTLAAAKVFFDTIYKLAKQESRVDTLQRACVEASAMIQNKDYDTAMHVLDVAVAATTPADPTQPESAH